MKKLLIPALSVILYTACKDTNSSDYTITGKITGLDSGYVLLYNVQEENADPDTAKLTGGSFEFKGVAAEPRFVYLGLEEGTPHQPLGFFLEKGKLTINASLDSLERGKITGSKSQDEFAGYQSQFSALVSQQRSLMEEYQTAGMANDQAKMEAVQQKFEALEAEGKNLAVNFIKANPKSFVSAFLMAQTFAMEGNIEEVEPLFSALADNVKGSFFGKEVAKNIDALKKTSVGAIAPDFTLNDPAGKPVALSSLRGKYLLVDFWAAWCGPCRQENPNVVNAYHTFKDKGFDVLGVSLDENKEKWEQAIAQDQLAWTQISDLKGWRSEAATLYGIKGIPMNYLLDKEGKIIAKNLRGPELITKLQELLK